MGAFVAADEAIAPHKGKGPMRMYIPRIPHALGVKLYVLVVDATTPYVLDMYIYKGKCRLPGARRYECAGRFKASEITNYWADQLPRDTTLVCASFFGSHKMADTISLFGTQKYQRRACGGTTTEGGSVSCGPHGGWVLLVCLQKPSRG